MKLNRVTGCLRISVLVVLGLVPLTAGCVVRITTARAVTGRVVDDGGNPVPGALLRIDSHNFKQPREVIAASDGRFRYGGKSPWGLFLMGDIAEFPLMISASDNGRSSTVHQTQRGFAQLRLLGFGRVRSTDVGDIVIVKH